VRGREKTLISSTAGSEEDAFSAFLETFLSTRAASPAFSGSCWGAAEEWLPPDLSSEETAVSPQAIPIEAAAETAKSKHSRLMGSDRI